MTAADRIAALTGLLNGELSELPKEHPAAIELRMALAHAHLDDGYPAGARSWLTVNADLLASAQSPTGVYARLLNAQRLKPVLVAGGETAASVELQRQIVADGRALFSTQTIIGEWLTLVEDLRRPTAPQAARDELLVIIETCAQDLSTPADTLANVKISLAEVLVELGELQQAIDTLKEARVRGTDAEQWLGWPWRRAMVSALNASGQSEQALALLRDDWVQRTSEISPDFELILCLELAQQTEREHDDGIIDLLEPQLSAFVKRFGADDYYTLEATTLLARQLGLPLVRRNGEAAALLEPCLTIVSDPAHDGHWRLWSLESQIIDNSYNGDRARGLAVARAALERENFPLGEDRQIDLLGNIATLSLDDPATAVAAAEEYLAAVRSRRFLRWHHRERDAAYALADALEVTGDVAGNLERSLSVREGILTDAVLCPEPDPEVIYFARLHVARLSGRLGDYRRASALLEASLADPTGLAASSPTFRIECERILAATYADAGRIDDALQLIEQTSLAAAVHFSRDDSRRTAIDQLADSIRSQAAAE
jgi:hypothetical protein